MARLPQPGSDKGTWGDILNDFLSQAHNADGSLKTIFQSQVSGLTTTLGTKADAATVAATYLTPSGLTQRTGVLSLTGDFATDNISAIANAFTQYDYVSVVPDATGNVLGISGTIVIPAGKTLEIHPALTIKAFANNTSSYLIRLAGNRARLLCHGTLDGNLAARDASGALTTCCWGAVVENVSETYVEIDRAVDFGKVAASSTFDGGAVLINKTSTATAHVTGNVAKVRRIEGAGLNGFMMRIRSDFAGIAEVDSAYYCQYNEIHCPQGVAGNKNCVEVVGPHTRFNNVYGGVAIDPTGQGGFEADFGAYNNTFHNPTVVFSPGTTLTKTFDGFSQRTSDQGDGKLKISRGNRFIRPRLIGGTLSGTFSLRMMNVNIGTDAVFESPEAFGASAGTGTTGYLNMLSIDTTLGKVDRVRVIRPNVQDFVNAIRPTGVTNVGLIEIEGGRIDYTGAFFTAPSNIIVDHLSVRGVTITGTPTALTLGQVMVTDVVDNEFVGQTGDTISGPLIFRSVLRFGRNIFRCGSTSGFPVTVSSSGSGYVIDLGGNVYTARIPGSATNGSQGRVRASGANVLAGTLTSTGAEQQAVVRVTTTPSAGTWNAGDEWQHPAPASGAVPGGYAVGSGTYGTYSSTADTTSGSKQVTAADVTGLKLGDWVSVAGAVTKGRVEGISGNVLTLTVSATATVSGAVIAHIAPTWKTKAAISP